MLMLKYSFLEYMYFFWNLYFSFLKSNNFEIQWEQKTTLKPIGLWYIDVFENVLAQHLSMCLTL